MFIAQVFKPENRFWKYIIGILIVFAASIIGQIPLTVAVVAVTMSKGQQMPTDQMEMLKVLDSNLNLFLMLVSFAVGLIGLVVSVKLLHGQKFREIITSRPKIDWKRVFFAFFLWFIISSVTIIAGYFIEPETTLLQFNPERFIILFVIAVVMIPIQTSFEELVFRGYLMQGFGLLAMNRWVPLVLTSLIFGMLHIANPEVDKIGYIILVYYIGTGLFLGILTLMDEGAELALGFHAANNLSAALLVTADWTVFQTDSIFKDTSDPSAGMDILLPVLVIFPIVLFIFSRKYKWSNWKEKLTGKIELPEHNGFTNKTIPSHD